ncbi:hypothetical protein D3C84_902040 [compost metagenome]
MIVENGARERVERWPALEDGDRVTHLAQQNGQGLADRTVTGDGNIDCGVLIHDCASCTSQ